MPYVALFRAAACRNRALPLLTTTLQSSYTVPIAVHTSSMDAWQQYKRWQLVLPVML